MSRFWYARIYWDGYYDNWDGWWRSDNPYCEDTYAYDRWDDGWCDAEWGYDY